MKIQDIQILAAIALTFLLSVGCILRNKADSTYDVSPENHDLKSPVTEISYVPVTRSKMSIRQFLKGKIVAFRKVTLKFEYTGRIENCTLVNGLYVTKEQQLAKLDDRDLQYQLAEERLILEEAENNRFERLMGVSGMEYGDTTATSQQNTYINIVSGYNKALQAIKKTEYLLTKTIVTAPFSGKVANLKVKPFEYVNPGQEFCTLIDPSSYEGQFFVPESMATHLKKGQRVVVTPATDNQKKVMGRLKTINPVVGENGLVEITAVLNKGRSLFFEGMNIEVTVEEDTPPFIIVPKRALVLRSGKEVVFSYSPKDSLAKWNYVTVAYENDESLAISEGLEVGDLVIVDGNLNLDHDARVRVKALDEEN